MLCEATALGICFNRPPSDAGFAIFGFAEFLSALALLVLVYNAADVRYRFRVSAAPVPLYRLTFVSTAIIGFGSLFTDLWFSERWLAPAAGLTRAEIQTFFGAVFLSVVLLWTLFAFVAPSRFGQFNARRFAQTVHSFLMRGGREDLDAVSTEIGRSAAYIFRHAAKARTLAENEKPDRALRTSIYAHELLLLIAHKRLCQHIVTNDPAAAILIADEAHKTNFYAPLGQFLFRITDAALEERDSIVFHEGEYFTGLIGRMRSFINSIYGRFQMIENSGHSALDLDHKLLRKIEPDQLTIYSEMIVTAFKSYLSTTRTLNHSYSLHRSLGNLRDACSPLSSLDKVEISYENRIFANLNVTIDTLKQLVDAIDATDIDLAKILAVKSHGNHFMDSMIDSISFHLVEIMTDAGNISGPIWSAWSVQHNTIWSRIFSGESKRYSAWWFVQLRIRQKIYRELKQMEKSPNYQHARMLRFLLNVMKWTAGSRQDYPPSAYRVRRMVIPWVSRHFMNVFQSAPDVGQFCLTDDMFFDQKNARLGKRHEKSLFREETWTYLKLLPTTVESSEAPTA